VARAFAPGRALVARLVRYGVGHAGDCGAGCAAWVVKDWAVRALDDEVVVDVEIVFRGRDG
jgi:hypothetical protein